MAVKQTIPSNTNQTKSLTFSKLRGVDYSSSPFEVSTSRAVHMKNIINEDGVNHKRPGWTSNLSINRSNNLSPIYDICEFGGRYLVVALFGYDVDLYEWDGKGNFISNRKIVKHIAYTNGEPYTYSGRFTKISEDRMLFTGNNTGIAVTNNFVVITYNKETDSIEGYETEDVLYIPTTSISINSTKDNVDINSGVAYEERNMLTTKRKNSLIGENIETIKITFKYQGYTDTYISCVYLDGGLTGANIDNFSNSIRYDYNSGQGAALKEISFRIVPGRYKITVGSTNYDGYDKAFDEDGNVLGETLDEVYGYYELLDKDMTIYIREG